MKACSFFAALLAIFLLATAPEGQAAVASAPVIMPGTGTYFDSVDVSLYTATVGATIFYTTDGSTPTTDDRPFTFPFTLTESAVVKAITVRAGSTNSAVSTAVIDIVDTPADVVPTVTIAGKKSLKTLKAKIKIRGAATDATSVEYQIGPEGDFKTASGTSTWTITAKLKPGKNVIYVYAIGTEQDSAPAKVTVTLLKKKS